MFDAAAAGDPMPWSTIWLWIGCLVGGGGLVTWIGARGATGRLPRNWIAGIPTTPTLSSDGPGMRRTVPPVT